LGGSMTALIALINSTCTISLTCLRIRGRLDRIDQISKLVHRLVVQGSIFHGNTGIEMANARDGTEFCQP